MVRRALVLIVLAWLPTVGASLRFWRGSTLPRFGVPAPWSPEVRRLDASPGAYDLALDPAGAWLVVTHAHARAGENGVAVLDLDTGARHWTELEHDSALYVSHLGDRAIVHDAHHGGLEVRRDGTTTALPSRAFRSAVTAAGELVMVERFAPWLWWRDRPYRLPDRIGPPDEVRLDVDGRTAWVRGDCGDTLARVDLEAGTVEAVRDRRFSWGLAPRDGGGVYETHAVAGRLVERDGAGRVVRERFVGGFPREVVRLDGTPWLAVGQYLGGVVLVLDVTTLETVARIPAAWHVRGIAWDRERRRLYFTDSAGVEVAELGNAGGVATSP